MKKIFKFRAWIQAATAVLTNGYLQGFLCNAARQNRQHLYHFYHSFRTNLNIA